MPHYVPYQDFADAKIGDRVVVTAQVYVVGFGGTVYVVRKHKAKGHLFLAKQEELEGSQDLQHVEDQIRQIEPIVVYEQKQLDDKFRWGNLHHARIPTKEQVILNALNR